MAFAALLEATDFVTESWHPSGSAHKYTSWIVRRASDGVAVVENLWDEVNLLSYLTPAVLLDGVEYEILLAHVDAFGYETWSDPVTIGAGSPVLVSLPERHAWAFTLDGHIFYVLNTPGEPTLLYDMTTGQWCTWTTGGYPFWNIHRGIMWNGLILGASAAGAKIWLLDPAVLTDEGTREIERVVTGFQAYRGSGSIRQGSLRMTAGRQGVLGADAAVTLRFSDDGGRTWSRDYAVELNAGDVSKKIEFRSLGRIRAPGRLWELSDVGGVVRIDGLDSDTEGSNG